MRKFGFILCFLVLALIFTPNSAYAALNWNETQPAGDVSNDWTPSAISSNGQKMIVGHQSGGLYISSNGGSSWTRVLSELSSDPWYTASMSSDGQVILAGAYSQRIYLSTDGGVSWSETRPIGDASANWLTSSMSASGEVILVASELGRLYRSTNGGDSWTEIRPAGNVNASWHTDISSDGQTMLAGVDGGSGGRLYISTNAGDTWSETRPDGNVDRGWRTVSMSDDGQVMIAGEFGQRIYLSTNGGSSWAETQPAGDQTPSWVSSVISSDGRTLVTSSTQRLYTSTNQAAAWSELQPIGNQDGNWQLLNISGNGQVLLAGNYDSRLYIGSYPSLTNASPSVSFPSCNDTAPGSVPNLFQIDPAGTSANLYFSTVTGGSGYNINYGLAPDANQYGDNFDYTGPLWTVGRTISSLQPNTTYYFKIQSINGCNAGEWSAIKSVKTKGKGANISQFFANLNPFNSNPALVTTKSSGQAVAGIAKTLEGCSYIIQSGDSLWTIALSKWGTGSRYQEIINLNPTLTSSLKIGQTIQLCQ